MRVTLVDNLVLPEERDFDLLDVHPHLGLLSLAAAAASAGHQVRVYDPKRMVRSGELPYDGTLYERVADALLADDPAAIGFTTLGCSFLFVVGVARAIERRSPDLPLLLGGPHATMLAEPILAHYPQFDVVARHEAEFTFPDVLDRLATRDFTGIPGITWRTPAGIRATEGSPRVDDLDALPLLDYDLYPVADLGLDLLRVEAGRGCPFACYFCSTATFFQRRYRLKSPERLVMELDTLRDRYAPREFKLDHDLFTVNKHKVREFCDAVAGHGHRWRVSARADCVDEELLTRMAEAGCVGLYLGVETGSRRMQKVVAKRLDLDLVEPVLDVCESLGIETTASYITGYPEESPADQDDTLTMLGDAFTRTAGTCVPQLHILTPEPGTSLFDRFGSRMEFDGYATPFNSWLLREEDRDEVLGQPEIFSSYYYYPADIDRATHVAVVETVDLLRGLGHALCATLIRRHERGLAGLVRALTPDRKQASLDDLTEYVRRWLGDDDPVTSAVRYLQFLRAPVEPTPSVPAGTVSPDPGPNLPLRLPTHARILHDVHDCTEVMAWLRGDGAEPVTRASYVRLAGDGPIRVEPRIVDLLHLFGHGRSATEITRLLGGAPGQWLPDLVEFGLLVPAGAVHA
jgi:radical SAM superfamily enzyme YgiQ (UPF0313 family)